MNDPTPDPLAENWPADVIRTSGVGASERIRPGLLAFARDAAPVEQAPRGTTLSREREKSDSILVLDSGFCVALKRTTEGQQQNVAFFVPGDVLNHESFTLGVSTTTIVALTSVVFYRLPHARLRDALAQDERLTRCFWHFVAFQGALTQEWMLSMGRRAAYERTAHLLCEFVSRVDATGELPIRCYFPFTQGEMADLLGLSVVHVNRTLQRLRQDGYIVLNRSTLDIVKWPELKALAGFDASYLDLADEG